MKSWIDSNWHQSAVGNDGWKTNVQCPNGDAEIIYNGNYFCANFSNGCEWAMSHDDETGDPIGKIDKEVWEKLKIANKNQSS